MVRASPYTEHGSQPQGFFPLVIQEIEPRVSCMLSKPPSTTRLHPSPYMDAKMILHRKDCSEGFMTKFWSPLRTWYVSPCQDPF